MADLVSVPLTDADIASLRANNNIPANAITVRTVNGGAIFIDPSYPNAQSIIAQYSSGQRGYSSYTNDPSAITGADSVPAGVLLRALPNAYPANQPVSQISNAPTQTNVPSAYASEVVTFDPTVVATSAATSAPVVATPVPTPPVSPLQPQVTLVAPYVDPVNTFRATSIKDIYTVQTDISPLIIVYNVGIPSTFVVHYAVRNNTIANDIQVAITPPAFLQIDSPNVSVIKPGAIIKFMATVNDDNVDAHVITRQFQDQGLMRIECQVLNVQGPVYVAKNLPLLSV